jgi:hypothetical protein
VIELDWWASSDLNLMLDSLKGKISSRKAILFACACCRRIWDLLIDERSRVAVEKSELYADHLVTASELERVWNAADEAKRSLPTGPEEQWGALKQTIRAVLGLGSETHSASQVSTDQIPESSWLDWACLLASLESEDGLQWLRELERKFETDNDVRHVLSQLQALRVKLESREEVSLMDAVQAYRKAMSWSFAAAAASRLVWGAQTEEEVVCQAKTVAKFAADAASYLGGSQCSLLREIVGNPFQPLVIDRSCVEWSNGAVFQAAQALYENRNFEEMPRFGELLKKGGCDSEDILNHCYTKEPHARGCWVLDLILSKQ